MGLTKALANEWASLNINVNAIAPGYMATNNTTALRQDSDRNDAILCRIPAGRWGTSDDLMGAAVFSCQRCFILRKWFLHLLLMAAGWLDKLLYYSSSKTGAPPVFLLIIDSIKSIYSCFVNIGL